MRQICARRKALAAIAMVLGAGQGLAGPIARAPFGTLPNGTTVEIYTLSNRQGMTARIITLGAIVQSLEVPDAGGHTLDVVLGCDTLEGYLQSDEHFGGIIGRYANRIAGGHFTLDGKEFTLPINDPPNTLHGGTSFDKAVWKVEGTSAADNSLRLSHVSAAGDQGFPGELTVRVTYTLTDANELRIDFTANTSAPTVVNLTNHSYFNLSGEGSREVLGDTLMVRADAITVVDKTLIPTGELAPVAGTAFDFRKPRLIGERIRDGGNLQILYGRGYDINFVLRPHAPGALAFAARLSDPRSRRVLEVYTSEPGLQLYTANFLNGTRVGKRNHTYRQSDAICLETQHFPDSPNHPKFPSTVLRPGEPFRSSTLYRFSTLAH